MNGPVAALSELSTLEQAAALACARIAPSWPLDHQVAVNPLWGCVDRRFDEVADALWQRAGAALHMPMAYYAEAWGDGRISPRDLESACEADGGGSRPAQMLAALETPPAPPRPLPLLSEIADTRRDRVRQPDFANVVRNEVGDFCAAYFDRGEAGWCPDSSASLFGAWLAYMRVDSGLGRLLDKPELRQRVRALPEAPEAALRLAVEQLQVPTEWLEAFFETALRRNNGWASWCAYRRWQAGFEERSDASLKELLAVRVAWEWLLDDGARGPGSVWAEWQACWRETPTELPAAYRVWQRALELAGQRRLLARLGEGAPSRVSTPRIQATFCIDVRSERLRRRLEAELPALQTLGFAGFFGLPIALRPFGASTVEPRLPGLLAPAHRATETSGNDADDARLVRRLRARLPALDRWRRLARLPLSGFSQVELFGLGYVLKLARRSLGGGKAAGPAAWLKQAERAGLRPQLDLAPDSDAAVDLAESILRGMSLTTDFAPLILLVGHESASANNPHASGLDCGACGGHSGLPNARLVADLLNAPLTRQGLAERGIAIPDATRFLAARHDTTRETLSVLSDETQSETHRDLLQTLREAADRASQKVREERAPSLGLAKLADDPRRLAAALDRRARDWSQTRPEWGLAGNLGMIIAPRERTRGLDLGGRIFLHDYRPELDSDGSILTQLMSAPMVVSHWINMQYFASTTDNTVFGSGNKLLHNVVGGGIGVFEGNGGDLRIGLPRQSLHDGERWIHTPCRLTVVVEAPRERIDAILQSQATVRDLVANEWLYLVRLDPATGALEVHRKGAWQTTDEEAGQ